VTVNNSIKFNKPNN